MFTLLPTSRLEWQKTGLVPFQAYLVTAIFFYLWFAHDWPNRAKSDSFLSFAEWISGGYFLCFLTFTVVSVVQFFRKSSAVTHIGILGWQSSALRSVLIVRRILSEHDLYHTSA
jgi:hypothetical protein